MKKIIIHMISLTCLFMLGGCGLSPTSVKDFIPGIYVKDFNGQYAGGSDTLVIANEEEVTGRYTIERRMGYIPVHDGKASGMQLKKETWSALYNSATKQLFEQHAGKVLSFSLANHCLYIGNSVYKKIK